MGTCIEFDCEQWLRRYEKMTCVLCGEPLKIHIANYDRNAHVKCLLKEKSEPARCWLAYS
jgi:hypothetical protein